VHGSDANFLQSFGDVLGSKHSSVWGCFVTVSLDLHASSDTDNRFLSGKISNVYKRVVERREDVCNAEGEFTLPDGWTELNGFLDLPDFDFFA